MHVTARADHM